MIGSLRSIAADLKAGLVFSTRFPIASARPLDGTDIARASWALPVIGLLVGLAGALAYGIAWWLALPPLVAAALAVAATLLATGALHEDGLADTFDGLGGGFSRERKLDIMRDSRIGTYGACALAISLLLRAGALASLGGPSAAALALIASHAAARGLLPAFLRLVPPARSDGLAAGAGRPPASSVVLAAVFGAAALGLGLGPRRGIIAGMLLIIAFILMRRLCLKQIGGQTGDVAGALEQVGEIVVLLTAAAGA
jgi:adenosylcobinamide-GDP ribazoletransferase